MPAGVHNGSSLTLSQRNDVITLLSEGHSVNHVAGQLDIDWHIVRVIRDDEWRKIETRRDKLAAMQERKALLADTRILNKLESDKDYSLNELNVISGTSIDKALALRGDATQTIRHLHSFDLSDDDLIAFAVQRSNKLRSLASDKPPPLGEPSGNSPNHPNTIEAELIVQQPIPTTDPTTLPTTTTTDHPTTMDDPRKNKQAKRLRKIPGRDNSGT